MLIRLDMGYALAGVELEADKVTRAAPILKYMRGWTTVKVLEYAHKKGWKVDIL
jgi:hypothetical protein